MRDGLFIPHNSVPQWQRHVTNKFFKTSLSRTSTKLIFTQVIWSIQWPCQQVQCFIKTCWLTFFILNRPLFIHRTNFLQFFLTITMSTRLVKGKSLLLLHPLFRGLRCQDFDLYLDLWISEMVSGLLLSYFYYDCTL